MKKMQKNDIDDDEIKILKKYQGLDTLNKILICMYALIGLSIINIALPYIVDLINNMSENKVSRNGEYDISMFNSISESDIAEIGKSNDVQVLFICSEAYKECADFLPVVQKGQNEYGYVTNYLQADILNSEEAQQALLSYDNEEEFIRKALGQIPMVLTLKKGKIVQGWVGISKYNDYNDFLKNSGIGLK